MNVFDISAKISLDTSEYIKSLGDASSETSSFGDKIKGAFSTSMQIGAAAIGAVVTETVALSGALVKGVNDLASYGDHIDKQSQKMNMSAQAYQEWDAIMQHSGTSIDSMQMSMKTLANAAESGNDAFGLLGMSLEDVQRMSSEELFSETITALQNVESDTQRTYIAGQLLGRGATELGALLNTSAEDTEKMRQRVHELGGVMSDDAVKASAKFKDSLQDMKTSMSGLTRGITSEFLPSFTEVMDGLTAIFAGEDGGAEKVSKGIDGILGNISSSVTKLKPVVSKIGGVLTSAVKENAPKLIKEGTKLFGDIVVGVVQNLPDILSTAGDVVGTIGSTLFESASTLVTGFSGYLRDNLPTLIPEGVNAVVEFAKGITDPSNSATLVDAAFDIVDGLIEGLTNEETINSIIEGAPVIVENLVTGIVEAAPKLADAALKITGSLLDYFGNEENRQKMKDSADKILKSLLDGFTSLLGEGGEFVYKIGGLIADAIGLGEYWQAGNDVLQEWWDGFKVKWEEFKKWFDEEINLTLNPIELGKEFGEKMFKGIDEAQDERHSNRGGSHKRNAMGGVFTKPTYDRFGDLYGEAGTEVLLPLDSNTGWMDKFADKLENRMNGGATYTFNFYYQGGNGMSDAEIEEQAKRLAELSISQIRAVGGTGF